MDKLDIFAALVAFSGALFAGEMRTVLKARERRDSPRV